MAGNLIQEAGAGNLEKVIELLSGGTDVNARDERGLTALMEASVHGHAGTVMALLEFGAEIEERETFYGCTALMFASLSGTSEVVEALLRLGANTNARDRYHRTPLMAAAAVGNIQAVRMVMDSGADLHVESPFGTTAADFSAIEGYAEITALLMPASHARQRARQRAA